MNIQKALYTCLLLSFLSLGYAQPEDKRINWSENYSLKWGDFLGRPEASSPFGAYSGTLITYRTLPGDNKDYTVTIIIAFDKEKSWVKPEKEDGKLLAHEQRHFDIAELYARMFAKRIQERGALSAKQFNEKMREHFKKITMELRDFQQQYDSETSHSKNEVKQKEWEEKVKKLLDKYKDYTQREIKFQF